MEFVFDPDVVNHGAYTTEGLGKVEAIKVIRAATDNRFNLKYYKDVLEYNLGSRNMYSCEVVGALIAAWHKSGYLD